MAAAYFVGIIFVLVVIVAIFGRDESSGCGGTCNQGRDKCDCKNIF